MDTLHLLEEKIGLLVGHIKKLQEEREGLLSRLDESKKEHAVLTDDVARVSQENKKLQVKLKELQKTSSEESRERELLSHEREQALLAVDNLIKSIDGLIASDVAQ